MNDPTQQQHFHAVANADTEQALAQMWAEATQEIRDIDPQRANWKIQTLPLARIKKIMKSEEFIQQELEKDRLRELGIQDGDSVDKPAVKFMISGEAPLLMSKACELLIRELSTRAWQHTERNRRRTLQRQDLHAAVGESDVYDFLIDIVPRVTNAMGGGGVPVGHRGQPPVGGIDPTTQHLQQHLPTNMMAGVVGMPGPPIPGVVAGNPHFPVMAIGMPTDPSVMMMNQPQHNPYQQPQQQHQPQQQQEQQQQQVPQQQQPDMSQLLDNQFSFLFGVGVDGSDPQNSQQQIQNYQQQPAQPWNDHTV